MKRVIFNALFVVGLGSFLHFAWELSGRSSIVAMIAAVNESTWEHLKMAFWPALFLAPIHYLLYAKAPGILPATVIRTLLSPVLIVIIFYSYLAILARNILFLDIGTFVLAVFIAELAGEWIMRRRWSPATHLASAVLVCVAMVAFATLTFHPPQNFLFKDPSSRMHGLEAIRPGLQPNY
jgi:hypothetical protein